MVASEAAVNGSTAAIADAHRRAVTDEEFRTTVNSAGQMLMSLRLYPQAADLLEAAASGANASRVAGLAAVLRKTVPRESLQFGDDPAGVVMQSLMLLPESVDYNNAAWYALFAGNVTQADLDNAVKATQLNNKDTYAMHTLGCVYAELGKTKESREVLIQAMDVENLDDPTPPYWYAFGRIAEQCGLRETAAADYDRVPKPKRASEVPGSSYRLAFIRSQAMNSTAKSATKTGGTN